MAPIDGGAIEVVRRFGSSAVRQRLAISRDARGLEIDTWIDWRERHRVLKLAFPLDVHADHSTAEIQYGHLARPAHENTSWDAARFEVPAEIRADLSFHLVDSRNAARVRYERVNAETGEEVPWDRIVKGYEYADGSYVLLSDQELERASVEMTKTIEIEQFV